MMTKVIAMGRRMIKTMNQLLVQIFLQMMGLMKIRKVPSLPSLPSLHIIHNRMLSHHCFPIFLCFVCKTIIFNSYQFRVIPQGMR